MKKLLVCLLVMSLKTMLHGSIAPAIDPSSMVTSAAGSEYFDFIRRSGASVPSKASGTGIGPVELSPGTFSGIAREPVMVDGADLVPLSATTTVLQVAHELTKAVQNSRDLYDLRNAANVAKENERKCLLDYKCSKKKILQETIRNAHEKMLAKIEPNLNEYLLENEKLYNLSIKNIALYRNKLTKVTLMLNQLNAIDTSKDKTYAARINILKNNLDVLFNNYSKDIDYLEGLIKGQEIEFKDSLEAIDSCLREIMGCLLRNVKGKIIPAETRKKSYNSEEEFAFNVNKKHEELKQLFEKETRSYAGRMIDSAGRMIDSVKGLWSDIQTPF